MSITDVVGNSFDILKKNLIVAVPYIIYAVVILILAIILILGLITQFFGSAANLSTILHSTLMNRTANGTITNASLHTYLPLFHRGLALLPYLFTTIIIFAIVVILLDVFVMGMYISLGRQAYKKEKLSLEKAFSETKSRYLSLLGATILSFLIIIAVSLIFFALIAVSAIAVLPLAILLGLLWIVAMIILVILFYQRGAAVMLEGKNAFNAIQRSIEIGKKNFWSIFALYLIFIVIAIVISILGLIPILGILIRIIGDIILAITAALAVPTFYFAYVGKGQEPKTSTKPKPKRPKRRSRK